MFFYGLNGCLFRKFLSLLMRTTLGFFLIQKRLNILILFRFLLLASLIWG